MSRKIKYFLVVLAVFVAGFLFSLFASDRALADPVNSNRKPLLVEILNLPLAITGAVSVDNLPVDETSNSLRTTSAADGLRDGVAIISFGEVFDRRLAIPEGVALTDAVVERVNTSDDDTCVIWFDKIENNAQGPMIILQPSVDKPIAELHFESGLRSTPGREIGFFVNSRCRVRVLWTGYEY